MPDSVVSACSVLDGVSVLWINRYAAGGNLFLDLEVVESLTEDPASAPFTLNAIARPLTFAPNWSTSDARKTPGVS